MPACMSLWKSEKSVLQNTSRAFTNHQKQKDNPIVWIEKDLNRTFSRREMQTVNKHLKRCVPRRKETHKMELCPIKAGVHRKSFQ